jgi:branched-chain amino acid aminotransferase
MDGMAWINGKVCRPEEATISVFDRGFLFGDGVYETGRSYGRVFLFMEEHLSRLRKSAGKLAIPFKWTDEYIRESLAEVARAYQKPDIYFRTIVTRGPIAKIGLDVLSDPTPSLVHLLQPIYTDKMMKLRQEGVHIVTSRIVRNSAAAQDPNIKTSNYLNSLLALQDAQSRGGEDAIMCNAAGQVTEGTTFSVFGVRGETLITPALSIGILDSITRRHVMEAAQGSLKVEEGFYTLSEFLECDETFIASSVREVVPIRQWDARGFDTPGPKTKLLQERLTSLIQKYLVGKTGY